MIARTKSLLLNFWMIKLTNQLKRISLSTETPCVGPGRELVLSIGLLFRSPNNWINSTAVLSDRVAARKRLTEYTTVKNSFERMKLSANQQSCLQVPPQRLFLSELEGSPAHSEVERTLFLSPIVVTHTESRWGEVREIHLEACLRNLCLFF